MTRALVTQMLEALDELHGNCSGYFSDGNYDMKLAEKAITAARAYLETEPSGERAELIARLFECLRIKTLTTREATAIKDAADMLEADAQQAKRVPMTGEEIEKIADGCRAGAGSVWPHAFVRAIEAHHGITPK